MPPLDRSERAFLVGNGAADSLEARVMAWLAPSRYGDRGQSRIRSVYLDTDEGELSRRILADPRNSTKLRLRSYHTSAPGRAQTERSVWVEVKRRAGDRVTKCRFRTVQAAIPAVLRGGTLPYGECDQESYLAQTALRRIQAGRRLHATVGVDYLRRSYESPDGAIRVTFDRDLGAWGAPAGPGADTRAVPGGLSDRVCLFPGTVLEVKLRAGAAREPAWLTELLAPLSPRPFSKAATALLVVGAATPPRARAVPA